MKNVMLTYLLKMVTVVICEVLSCWLCFSVDYRLGLSWLLGTLGGLCGREAVAGMLSGLNMGKVVAQMRAEELNLPLIAVCPVCHEQAPRTLTLCPHCAREHKIVKLMLERDYSKGKNESGS